MTRLDELLAIERVLWTNDAVRYRERLTPDALLVFPETGPISRDFAVRAIETENAEGRRWTDVTFDEARFLVLGDDIALLHYRAVARWEGETTPIEVLASSLYVRQGDDWRLTFHQQSAVPPR